MRRPLLLSPLSVRTLIQAKDSGRSPSISFKFSTFSTQHDSKDSEAPEEFQNVDPFLIIQDNDLLRGSSRPELQTGLHDLDRIGRGALGPGPEMYNRLFKKCAEMNKPKEGRMVHAHFLKSKFKSDLFLLSTVVFMYAKCGSLGDAQKAFDKMPIRDTVTWTALITGYSQNDLPEEALRLFPDMLRLETKPNACTFASLLKACGATPADANGRQIHAFCIKYGADLNVYVGSSLLDMYARRGDMKEAHAVFDALDSKNEVSWNALIAGYARKGNGEAALKVFWNMHRESFKATRFTFSTVLSACASMGSLEQGKWVHAHLIKSGEKHDAVLSNTLLDMYAKSSSIEDARKVFDRLEKGDVVTWNSMLTGCAQHGLGRETVQRFEQMLRHGIRPNEITFLCVLTACSHGGLVSEGQYYYQLMKEYDIEPEIEHYVTFVDLLGRAELLKRAETFIKEMPIEPTAAVWGALLGACRMHRNLELGAFAAERVFELDPYDSGPPVILSNMYALAGRREAAAKVKKMMIESRVKKESACSWVEIQNSVHMFVANDDSHPQIEEIRKMWEHVRGKIREAGYVPDTEDLLLLVDQQEREANLQHHCEKLALAFALMNTPPSATIRIKNNIRMCGDCHSAIKLVSEVMERGIVVRDKNRFHHFSGGSCSCGDYW